MIQFPSMQDFLSHLEQLAADGRAAVLATLVATYGARPRRVGARLLMTADGATVGSVTLGGCVEARVAEAAQQVLEAGRARLLRVDLGAEEALDLGMGCAATLELLVEPILPGDDDAGSLARGAALVRERLRAGGRAALVARLDSPATRLVVFDDGAAHSSLGDAALDAEARASALDAIGRRASSLATTADGAVRLFVDVYVPPLELFVFGIGPVTAPLVRFARELGMRTVVVDPRPERAESIAPDADEVRVGSPGRIAEELVIDADSAVVVLAHDYKHELPVLERVLRAGGGYVGLLGSRRRGRAVLDALAERGVPEEDRARVRVPAGLDVGAESPTEIALAILAEVIAVRTGRAGTP